MSKGSNRRPGDTESYEDNYDKIFGNKDPERGSWVYCPVRKRLIAKEDYVEVKPDAGYQIMDDIQPFVSPITQEVISSRSALRAHNKEHGVTNSADYSHEFMLKRSGERNARLLGQTKEARKERVELLKHELDKRGIH